MMASIQGAQASASMADDGAVAPPSKPKPGSRMPRPPSFTITFGQVASSRIAARQTGKTASRRYGADAQHAAAMVQHHRHIREVPCQPDQPRQLREVQPGVEAQPHRAQLGDAGAEIRAVQQVLGRAIGGVEHALIGIPGGDVADAAEPPAAGPFMRLQHRPHRRPQRQIGLADDAGADPDIAIHPALAHRRDPGGEFRLAHRPHRHRPIGPAHAAAGLHQHRRPHVVPRADIGQHLVQQVAPAVAVPQVVVRVDDELAWVEDRLQRRRQPVFPHRDLMSAHGASLPHIAARRNMPR